MKRTPKRVLIIYCLCFYAIWTCFEIMLKPYIDSQILKSGVIKNLIWTLPACLLIYQHSESVQVKLKDMFINKVNWLKYLPVFASFAIYILASSYFLTGEMALSKSFTIDSIIIVAFVGITEEMVFRGWLLNATVRDKNKIAAASLNALMFLCIHFPVWIYMGEFITNFQNLGFLALIALSVIFSVTFLKSRNILVPIALHMFWDLLMFMFF